MNDAWERPPEYDDPPDPEEPDGDKPARRPCLFNCKAEGPPGPIWCRQCGHDPKCCNCSED